MISQKYRFHGHNSLKYVFSNGKVARSKFFTIKWINNKYRHYPRLSVVVSKKIFKSAVKRNRIRRCLYETARPLLVDTPAVDIVLVVNTPEVLEAPQSEIAIQLLPLLHKAGLKGRVIHE